MKKLTAMFICLLLVASLVVTAFAAEAIKVDIAAAKTSVNRGDVVDMTISIPEVANLRSGAVVVDYDKAVFEFVSGKCTQGDAMVKSFKILNNLLSGSFTYAEDETPESISGVLFNFKMKVLDDAAFGKSTITLSSGSLKTVDGVVLDVALGSVEMSVVCSNHTPSTTTTKEATCKEAGEKVTTCSACNAELGKEPIAKLPHTEVTTTTKEATCKEAGEKVTTCSVCFEELKKDSIAKLPHTEVTTTTKEATCKEAGEKVTACSVCFEELKKEAIAKLPHDNEIKVTKEATCSAEGEKTTTCKVCGESSTEKIAKLAHTLGEYTETKAPTCSAEGEKTATCSVCQETVTAPVEKLAHTWDEGVVTTPATTKKEGVKTFTCSVCKETKTEAIDKLKTPATGDNTMILPFVMLMVLSAAGVAVTVIGKKRFAR